MLVKSSPKKHQKIHAKLTGRKNMTFEWPSVELIHRPTIGGRWPVIFWKVVLFGVSLL